MGNEMKKSLLDIPYLKGTFEPWTNEGEIYELIVKGEIPTDLRGTYFRNGPNPQHVLNEKHHIFDGDGMIHAFNFLDKRVSYNNKWIRTDKFNLEREAGRSLFGGMANRWKDPSVLDRSGNVANTNIIWHGGKLLALFEAGPPVEMNPENLETIGPWDFYGKLDRAMTAHPKIDPKTGDLLFYSHVFGTSRDLQFYRADKNGNIVETKKIPTPFHSMIHDFVFTENYIIFPLFPLTISMERALKGESPIAWEPKLGTQFGIIPRQGDGKIRWLHTDACFAFHFMNAYEDKGQIIIDAIVADTIPEDAKPFQGQKDDYPTRLIRWNLNLETQMVNKEVLDSTRGEMPRIDERFLGQKYQNGYFAAQLGEVNLPEIWNAIIHFDFNSNLKQVYTVPDEDVVNEAIFVPKTQGREGEGYILCLVYRSKLNRSDLLVLNSLEISKGPIATVEIPHRVPFGFHGSWKAR
jgi:carotenoid cleavage dioxygenase-like enzyme